MSVTQKFAIINLTKIPEREFGVAKKDEVQGLRR